MRKRIWELDVLRGLAVWGMLAMHLIFDLVYLFALTDFSNPVLRLIYQLGGYSSYFFLIISGICVTLGSHPCRRGLQVFGCGMIITAVTVGMYLLGFSGPEIIIYFGVLHCLGICMLLWPVCKKLPTPALVFLGVGIILYGLYLRHYVRVDFPWLVPLGIIPQGFSSSDYFPLLPNLGYFLLGIGLGRSVYARKQTLLPRVNAAHPVLRFIGFFGRHSLIIYVLHQPVIAALVGAFALLLG